MVYLGQYQKISPGLSRIYRQVNLMKNIIHYLSIPSALLFPAVFLLCFWVKGFSPDSLLLCLFFSLLLAAALIDIRSLYIPDLISQVTAVLAILSLAAGSGAGLSSRLAGAVSCGVLLSSVSLASGGGIGGGDIKLMTAAGLFLGIRAALPAVFLAYVLAGLWYLIPLLRGRVNGKTEAPMAPFFALSLIIFGLWQPEIFRWYLNLLGLTL